MFIVTEIFIPAKFDIAGYLFYFFVKNQTETALIRIKMTCWATCIAYNYNAKLQDSVHESGELSDKKRKLLKRVKQENSFAGKRVSSISISLYSFLKSSIKNTPHAPSIYH